MKGRTRLVRCLLALLWMLAIFLVSATPAQELPAFGSWDVVVKKGGHMLAYAFLAILFLRALEGTRHRFIIAWFLAVLYALVDEFHQSFVPGRHPSLVDVFLFDGVGAALALLFYWLWMRYRERSLDSAKP